MGKEALCRSGECVAKISVYCKSARLVSIALDPLPIY